MSKTMKWIVGIVVGLVVGCVVGSIVFLVFSRMTGHLWVSGSRVAPRNVIPWDNMPMHPRQFPGEMSRGFFPFGGFLGGLLGLGFLVLILLGIVALVLSLTRSRQPAAAIVPQAPPAPLTENAEMAAPARACPNCQRAVNEDWNHCPYCGADLTPAEQASAIE